MKILIIIIVIILAGCSGAYQAPTGTPTSDPAPLPEIQMTFAPQNPLEWRVEHLPPISTPPGTAPITCTVNTTALNIRYAPDAESPILGWLVYSDTVRVVDAVGDWWMICEPLFGYIYSSYCTIGGINGND